MMLTCSYLLATDPTTNTATHCAQPVDAADHTVILCTPHAAAFTRDLLSALSDVVAAEAKPKPKRPHRAKAAVVEAVNPNLPA